MKVEVAWKKHREFLGESGSTGVTVTMAGPLPDGISPDEQNPGIRPMEMILLGVGGCASYDVVKILEKSRLPIEDCRVNVSAERVDAVPAVFSTIHLHFLIKLSDEFHPNAGAENKVARAIELSATKYCSASIMLGKAGVNMTHSYELIGQP